MTPEQRFHSYVTAATVTVMYFVIQYIAPFFSNQSLLAGVAKPVLAVLLSFGTYKLLAALLQAASRTSKHVKRFLLGASYVNGTWIGRYLAIDGTTIYTVEHFEQTLSSLVVRGEAFKSDSTSYASWTSVSATIDERAGMLVYTYACDMTAGKSSFQGVCQFQFERVNEKEPPGVLRGYSADLIDGVRTVNRETKHSEDLVGFALALDHAKKA